MPINTTDGPVEVPSRLDPDQRNVQTSDILEPPLMEYIDEEPEIAFVLPGTPYVAVFEDGHQEAVLFWVIDEEGKVHAVALGEDRVSIDPDEDLSTSKGFVRFERQSQQSQEEE